MLSGNIFLSSEMHFQKQVSWSDPCVSILEWMLPMLTFGQDRMTQPDLRLCDRGLDLWRLPVSAAALRRGCSDENRD